nr:MAG: hypothetical protein [Bacteriophage sp.]
MIRKFRAGTEGAKQKASAAKAKTPDGIARAGRKALGIEG